MMKGSMTAINQGAGTPENGILSPTLNKYRLRKHNEGDLASDRDKHRKQETSVPGKEKRKMREQNWK